MATEDSTAERRIDSNYDAIIQQAPASSAVTVDVTEEVANAVGTACLARAEYYWAYSAPGVSADTLEALSMWFSDYDAASELDRRVECGVVHLELAADACEWLARDLGRLGQPDPERVAGLREAAGTLRGVIGECRAVFQLSPRDGLAAEGASQ